MTSSELFPGDAYASLRERIRIKGEPRPYGTLLKEQAADAKLVCETCGLLPEEPGAIGNWIHMCHEAMDHVRETGHWVVVDSWNGAVYGPEA